MGNIPFRVVRGYESDILSKEYHDGFLYFTTDTKKIYLDSDNKSKIPMGGNSGIYYGNMVLEETPDEGQVEFEFSVYDIEGNEDAETPTIPNSNDLILNIPDGCFYRVMEVEENDDEIIIITNKLTIAGSGGSGGGDTGGGGTTTGSAIMNRLTPQTVTVLYQQPYSIGFEIIATDSSGETTGNGTYEILVGGVKVGDGTALQGENYVDVSPYLVLGKNSVQIKAYMDTGGSDSTVVRKTWNITTTQMTLTWDYEETDINSTDSDFTFSWTVSGSGFTKNTHIIIDDQYVLPVISFTSSAEQTYTITPSEYNLTHGSHKIFMYVTATLEGNEVTTNSITKNIIFVEPNNTTPIISCSFFEKELIQYNTVQIPIVIYSSDNSLGTATVILQENGIDKDTWENVSNQETKIWAYTPTTSGVQILTIQCGVTEKTLTLDVIPLDIDNEEIGGYAFKFKASEFASNNAIKNWNSNGVTATFSEKFDWVNGGLKTEIDENNRNRQYFCIKAGSTMEINYKPFEKDAKTSGKLFKIIFKTTKCKDYDAEFLNCYDFKWGVTIGEKSDLTIVEDTVVNYSNLAQVTENNKKELVNPQTDYFSADLANNYISYGDEIYYFDGTDLKYTLISEVNAIGLKMQAQNTIFKSSTAGITVPYCEDNYIEFELDISANSNETGYKKRYIKPWLDGVPCGISIYESTDIFSQSTPRNIIIGSNECDVQIYLIKLYEKSLSDDGHMSNFIADAPNAEEMVDRYNRNDILDENGEISPTKLAEKNPNCRVHLYDIPRITTSKNDKVKGCTYTQYHGNGEKAVVSAKNVTTRVQGTSSAAYGLAAYNLDSSFEDGFDYPDGTHTDTWQMDENAIGCNYFTTKVNVASCEGANNALNQEWYNYHQPYIGGARTKNPKARDTMQFYPGVLFLKDNNQTTNTEDGKGDNVFKDTIGYLSNPYYKLYSVCNMGNSKKNVHVFHDLTNPLECCVENGDNQLPGQWMVVPQGGYKTEDGSFVAVDLYSIDKNETTVCEDGITRNNRTLWETGMDEVYSFRYPDGIEEVKKVPQGESMIQGWFNFVKWMALSDPEAKYEEVGELTEEEFNLYSIDLYYIDDNEIHQKADEYISNTVYYKITDHINGHTNEPLSQSVTYGDYTFSDSKYTKTLAGLTVSTYSGTYDHDTYEYRMAKMLNECEEHLVMDSVVYHYLFIERHTMIDNVAKNTFWSTDDCIHWDLTKDYDNDTADGNDNQGKLTLSYGYEVGDTRKGVSVFNAGQSVWLNFIKGLYIVRQKMFQALDSSDRGAWNSREYLQDFKNWQAVIPERCWIEDYYRKYIRPYEVYNSAMFLEMLEGGLKTHQRAGYEIYQNYFISSKYFGNECKKSQIIFRSNGNNLKGLAIPAEVYADCYLQGAFGSGTDKPNFTLRAKRGEKVNIICPVDNATDATIYLFLPQLYQILGDENIIGTDASGNSITGSLNKFLIKQYEATGTVKLRKLVLGTVDDNTLNSLLEKITFETSELLEELYVANYPELKIPLNLQAAPGLIKLDARNSGFSSITIADNAPTTTLLLNAPTSLNLFNLENLEILTLQDYTALTTLNLNNIDKGQINSKNIVDVASQLTHYKLTDVIWNISNANEINEDNFSINILERLLKLTPFESSTSVTNLTGTLTIKESAYNGNSSLDIYNRYATPTVFPNLDINFESENSKLYNVTIYDGNKNIYWKRKLKSGDDINSIFLSTGPNGAFNISDIYKSPTPEYNYTFTKKWLIYDNADLTTSIGVLDATENDGIPYYENIYKDLYLVPQFETEKRSYELKFYGVDTSVPFYSNTYEYGTKLSDILITINNPYKDDSSLSLYETYDFKGYALIAGSTNPASNEYLVTNNQSFYAIFELVSDIREIVHEDWFNYTPFTYNKDIENVEYGGDSNFSAVEGYLISPKIKMKGKITIPSHYNNKPVVAIGGFGTEEIGTVNSEYNGITHIFVQKDSKLYEIREKGFNGLTTLKYFDFSRNTLRFLNSYSFRRCPLINTTISTNIFYLGSYCFNASFYSETPVIFTIPSSVVTIGSYGFSYTNLALNSTLNIGEENNYSKLVLSNLSSTGNIKFGQNNTQAYSGINFYTNTYTSLSDIEQYFSTQYLGTITIIN